MNNHANMFFFFFFNTVLKKLFHVIWDDYLGPKLGPVM